jgi:hypothetical protein
MERSLGMLARAYDIDGIDFPQAYSSGHHARNVRD